MKNRKRILENALKCKDFKTLDKKRFLKAWRAVFFLLPSLHPDEHKNSDGGWPEKLKPLAAEAVQRYENCEISACDFYPYKAAIKGLKKARQNAGDSL